MASTAEPIVSRLDRLDIMLRHLEEIKGVTAAAASPRDSYTSSAPSSGTLTTTTTDAGGNSSSLNSSPNKVSLEKRCRPIDAVIMETQAKGTLIVRVAVLEDRVLKLEEEIQEKKRRDEGKKQRKKSKKGLTQLVKSCLGGGEEPKVKHP